MIAKQVTPDAQAIVKDINGKYNTNLKYNEIGGDVAFLDENMFLPPGSIGAQFVVSPYSDGVKLIFLASNDATVEMTKRWATFLSGLNLDKEIQYTVDTEELKIYYKGDYKIRVGHSTAIDTMYVEIDKVK